jgi:hypothetical protein
MARRPGFSGTKKCGHRPRPLQRRIGVGLVAGLALGLVLGALSWQGRAARAQGTPAQLPLQPFGLIAVSDYNYGPQLTSGVYTNPSVSGVGLRVNWSDLEPSPNTFAWATITDPVFAQAQANNKFVVLIVVPGFETPAWALQNPATQVQDVATSTFARQYGPKVGQVGALPVPWDETYLSRWYALLQAVADRYGSNPAFLMVAADGPTSVSEEMSLPRSASDPAVPNGGSDLSQWEALGYTPNKYLNAWQEVIQEYAQIFPGQYVSLSLADGLPIGSTSTDDTSELLATPKAVVADALPLDPKPVLQENALTNAGTATSSAAYKLVQSNSGSMVTGFEIGDLGRVGTPSATALQSALQNGLDASVDFLEVYAFDAASADPAIQGVLQQTASQLPMPQYAPASLAQTVAPGRQLNRIRHANRGGADLRNPAQVLVIVSVLPTEAVVATTRPGPAPASACCRRQSASSHSTSSSPRRT